MNYPPTITIDTIQQAPLSFSLPTERGTLTTGDYPIKDLERFVAVGRKGPDDLVGCLKNGQGERFERELSGEQGLDYFALVVESLLPKYIRKLQKRFKVAA